MRKIEAGRLLVQIRATSSVSEQEQAALAQARARIDYGLPQWGYQWAPKTWRVLAWLEGELASHVGIVARTVDAGGELVKVGGISGVWTVPEQRGRGAASAAMRAAAAFMRDELQVDFGLLLCRQQLQPFYDRLGWVQVPGPLLFEQPFGKVVWPFSAMILPCAGRQWPGGSIDLRGFPW